MKTIGYAHGSLYRVKQGPLSIVVAAPDRKTAEVAFDIWLKDRSESTQRTAEDRRKTIKRVRSVPEGTVLLWALVDVTSIG